MLSWAWTVTSLPLFELAQARDVGTAGSDWNGREPPQLGIPDCPPGILSGFPGSCTPTSTFVALTIQTCPGTKLSAAGLLMTALKADCS